MSKHTKGPFKVADYVRYASALSKAEYPVHAKKRGLIGSAFRHADAVLFAASSDLLEAARAARCCVKDNSAAAKIIDAAIAKATGGQQ